MLTSRETSEVLSQRNEERNCNCPEAQGEGGTLSSECKLVFSVVLVRCHPLSSYRFPYTHCFTACVCERVTSRDTCSESTSLEFTGADASHYSVVLGSERRLKFKAIVQPKMKMC